ncbi:hypothetical protein M2164_000015 [Streptomyces sp. SAI-208]|uniref:hypothetical protein n=1 Tax=Streptomyces sp. SAI-208 TaxID=2940550 RepID=UPI002476A65B|nr:hypothetical protein [Streptomyces sp. SAI-208]MDH6604382.1 hypothetical protein [Streptomyces sp. SAI-208]
MPSSSFDQATPEGAAIADLFSRIKDIEESSGDWNGGEVVAVLSQWFSELHIDVDGSADQVRRPQAA